MKLSITNHGGNLKSEPYGNGTIFDFPDDNTHVRIDDKGYSVADLRKALAGTIGGVTHGPAVPLSPFYFSSADLKAAIPAAQVPYAVLCDGEQLIAGLRQPPVMFGSRATGTVGAMDMNHPYWVSLGYGKGAAEAVKTLQASPQAAQEAIKAIGIGDWVSGQATLDPGAMAVLILGHTGPGGDGSWKEVNKYRRWYYTTYPSGQAPNAPGALEKSPRNFENDTLDDAARQRIRDGEPMRWQGKWTATEWVYTPK